MIDIHITTNVEYLGEESIGSLDDKLQIHQFKFRLNEMVAIIESTYDGVKDSSSFAFYTGDYVHNFSNSEDKSLFQLIYNNIPAYQGLKGKSKLILSSTLEKLLGP